MGYNGAVYLIEQRNKSFFYINMIMRQGGHAGHLCLFYKIKASQKTWILIKTLVRTKQQFETF